MAKNVSIFVAVSILSIDKQNCLLHPYCVDEAIHKCNFVLRSKYEQTNEQTMCSLGRCFFLSTDTDILLLFLYVNRRR